MGAGLTTELITVEELDRAADRAASACLAHTTLECSECELLSDDTFCPIGEELLKVWIRAEEAWAEARAEEMPRAAAG